MKHLLFCVAVLALLTGCSENSLTDLNRGGGMIRFDPGTERTSVIDIGALRTNGFPVWAAANNVNDAWWQSVAGLKQVYESSAWGFETPVAWPAAGAEDYPLTFYALYPDPSTVTGFVLSQTPSTQELGTSYTVPADAANQTDLLGAKATASVRPANDILPITFKHLLSKLDFAFTVSTNYSVFVQGITVNNVANQGTYTYTASPAPAWTSITPTYTADYTYYGQIYPEGNNTGNTIALITWDQLGDGNLTQVYPGTHANHLMLLPQVVPTQRWAATAAPDGESYIAMVYLMSQYSSADQQYHDLVGYQRASSHPAWATSALNLTDHYPAQYPLSVKVGFPFDLNWTMGKGYVYNIALPATGGYLIDQYYYDYYGNRTDLIVGDLDGDGQPGPGPVVPDPVIGGSGYIQLTPIVSDWDDSTSVTR